MLKSIHFALIAALMIPLTASAQGKFLTATKGNWVAVREYDGNDLLYFTHLLAWRCGLVSVSFVLNDGGVMEDWPLTPCDEASPTPAAIGEDQKIYLTQPLNSISSVAVVLIYDDGTRDDARFERQSILIP